MNDQILRHSDEEKGHASLGTKREQGLRLMAIRQERPELMAFSASGHQGAVNGWTAASQEKRWIFRWNCPSCDILNVEGPLVEVGPRSVFVNPAVGSRQ